MQSLSNLKYENFSRFGKTSIKIFIVLTYFLSACTANQEKLATDFDHKDSSVSMSDWKEVELFSVNFLIPADLNDVKDNYTINHAPPDSTVRFYENEGIWLAFSILDSDNDSYDLEKVQEDYQYETAVIDGKPAKIFIFTVTDTVNGEKVERYAAVLNVSQINSLNKSLLMSAFCKSNIARKDVLKIFNSVQFQK